MFIYTTNGGSEMIHIVKYDEGHWTVWTDTEAGEQDGRCLGRGTTEKVALKEAWLELREDETEILRRLVE
jgi:hypothetical protein